MSMFDPNVRIIWNEPALDRMLNQPGGEVGRHLESIALKVQAGAKAIVKRRSGRLARSIKISHGRDIRGQYVMVGSNLRYAYWVHEGTAPHIIAPQHGRILRFREGGRVVYARLVHHPGSRGRKYLTIPLSRVVR